MMISAEQKNTAAMSEDRVKKIFIIEDNDMHSMMMDYLLSKDNSFNIFRFKSGEECIKRLNLRPDIIILDYSLPGINGMETYNQIKERDPKIPVVVITENRNDTLARKFKEEGVYDYILKEPNSFHRLNSVVESIVSILAQREYNAGTKRTMLLVSGFVMLIVISSIISFVLLKH